MTTSTLTRQLATAAVAGLGAGAVVVVLAGLVSGGAGAAGALVGGGVTLAVFAFGAVSVGLAASVHPRGALAVALVTYTLQVVLLVAFFAGLSRSGLLGDTLDRAWLAVAVVVVTLTWSALQVVAWQRGEVPLASPVNSTTGEPVQSAPTGGER